MEKLLFIEVQRDFYYVPFNKLDNFLGECMPIFKMEIRDNGIVEIEINGKRKYATKPDTKVLLYPNEIKRIHFSI